ncbi:uncharacterized protein LOC111319258 [Stylophora pistillata]|uniref:Caytaxin n=1 Tax=Stylophora pistillata TaxID=50429 RepID=A0A2B4SW44_STYPI|nr:uncharacterized protein LOC111319258 [Stylophora pistillata]PFX32772.1 Caytaxin [Stylophora pistillata]
MEEEHSTKLVDNTASTGYSLAPIDIDDKLLNHYIGNIIHKAASSLHGFVLKATSPEAADRDDTAERGSTPTNDSFTMDTQQQDSSSGDILENIGEPLIADSNFIEKLQGNHIVPKMQTVTSSLRDVAIKVMNLAGTEKAVLDCTESEQGYITEQGHNTEQGSCARSKEVIADDSFTLDSQEKDSLTGHTLESLVNPFQVPIEDSSSDSSLDLPKDEHEYPPPPKAGNKKSKFCRFKKRRKSSAVAPVTNDKLKETQPHKVAFDDQSYPTSDINVGTFITKSEHFDEMGNNIFLLNSEKVPLISKLFQGSKSKALVNNLCRNVEQYIKDNLVTDKFTMVIHGGDDGSKLGSIGLAKKFYSLLKNRFNKDLKSCIILRAKLSLKCIFKLSKPFMQNTMKQKISLVNDVRELVLLHRIPDNLLQYCH